MSLPTLLGLYAKKCGVSTTPTESGNFTMSIAIKGVLFATLVQGCMISAEAEFAPYRPALGGDYYLQYEACGKPAPHQLEEALVCEDACCIWETSGADAVFTCEETWCCHAEECEWFFHYEECY